MIIEPIITGTVKCISTRLDYCYCTYNNEKIITRYMPELISGKTEVIDNIIAATSQEFLDAEILSRGLIRIIEEYDNNDE